MKILVTAEMLCDLCGGHFTLDACKALCDYFDECGSNGDFTIGDICISFREVPADWIDEHGDDDVIAFLDNGNVLAVY